MSSVDPSEYVMMVKRRGIPPFPWRWEIFRKGELHAVERAVTCSATIEGATRAGKHALKQFLARKQAELNAEKV